MCGALIGVQEFAKKPAACAPPRNARLAQAARGDAAPSGKHRRTRRTHVCRAGLAEFMAANPVAAGVAITVTRSIGADLFAQVKVEKKAFPSEVNWRRITGFALFGGLYVAVCTSRAWR